MKYLSVCSGIESASVAWGPLGFEALGFSEIEPFPSAVLAHRWPNVFNFGDFTKIPGFMFKGVADILVGGTPCQAFSVAGKRESLGDDRGNLSLAFCELAHDMGVATVVWENVPGVLTTGDNAFGCFISKLCGNEQAALPCEELTGAEINGTKVKGPKAKYWRWSKSAQQFVPRWPTAGYAAGPDRVLSWRVLDAQFFGVAQRRRRVFVVASTPDGADPTAVLFEPEGVRRDSPPSRETGQDAAGYTSSSFAKYSRGVGTLRAEGGDLGGGSETLHVVHGTQDPSVNLELAHPLGRNNGGENVLGQTWPAAYLIHDKTTRHAGKTGKGAGNGLGVGSASDTDLTLTAGDKHAVGAAGAVRKLTPIECERLQGFPDGHTAVPYRNKQTSDCPDGPRYKAIGNSKAVPVVRWLGQRIQENLA